MFSTAFTSSIVLLHCPFSYCLCTVFQFVSSKQGSKQCNVIAPPHTHTFPCRVLFLFKISQVLIQFCKQKFICDFNPLSEKIIPGPCVSKANNYFQILFWKHNVINIEGVSYSVSCKNVYPTLKANI